MDLERAEQLSSRKFKNDQFLFIYIFSYFSFFKEKLKQDSNLDRQSRRLTNIRGQGPKIQKGPIQAIFVSFIFSNGILKEKLLQDSNLEGWLIGTR